MDRNKKWLFLGAILIMLCVMLPNYYVTGADDKPLTNSSFYFVGDGSKVVKIGEKLEITMNKTQLILTTEAGMPVDYTIEWHTSNDQIVTIQRDPSSANIVELQRKGPGFATISARIVGGGKIYTAYMYVVVDLKIKEKPDQTSPSYTELKQIKTTKEKAMILKYDPSKTNNEKKPIVLEFVSQPEIINNDFVQWETTDDKIVTVDKQGIVTPVGAGTATIKIKTNTTSSSEESIELSLLVVVEPLANITPYDPTPTWNDKGVITMNSSDFNISSNAIYADNLTWRVMDSYGNILPKDSKLLNYTISKSNGNLEVTNAKVGVYRIQAFAAKDFDKDTQVGYIDLTVIVPLLVPSKVIMNVGDTYDLVDNFNFSSPEDITTLETDSSNIVVPYKSKGSLVANSRGIATVKMSYLAYDANSSSGVSQKTITFQVEVIDGISLSATDTIIYTGETKEAFDKYLTNPLKHETELILTQKEKLEEEIFLGFRKETGINTNIIKEKFGIDFDDKYKSILEKFTPKYIEKTRR